MNLTNVFTFIWEHLDTIITGGTFLIVGIYKDVILTFLNLQKDNQVKDVEIAKNSLEVVNSAMETVNTLQEMLKNNNEMINVLEQEVNKAKQETVELVGNLNSISAKLEALKFKQEKIREACTCGAFDKVEEELTEE